MNKILVFFVFLFATFTLISALIERSGIGFASTSLTASVTATDTSISVVDTTGFLDSDVLIIESEQVYYTGLTATSFTGLTRGYNNTSAKAHAKYVHVRNRDASLMNNLVGYNIGEAMATAGPVKIFIAAGAYFSAFATALSWNYSFLDGNLGFLKYILFYPLSAGLIGTLIIGFLSSIWGILKP